MESSIPPAPCGADVCDWYGKEIVRDPASCREIVLLVKANALYEEGDMENAMKAYDASVESGSVEARIYRGFALAESAMENGESLEEVVVGLKDAMSVAAKMMEDQYLRKLHGLLYRLVQYGHLSGEKQLSTVEVNHLDIHDRIMDFVRSKGGDRAVLENLLEYLDAFYTE